MTAVKVYNNVITYEFSYIVLPYPWWHS